MSNYWISWWQPTDDYRPLTFPPNPGVMGWWKSGETMDEKPKSSLCAWVVAKNEDEAMEVVLKDWPEAEDWRFITPQADDWDGPGDRFPLPDWSPKRKKDED